MAFLTTSELTTIRADLTATLPTTCAIYYLAKTRDGSGSWTDGWTARGTAIACRMAEAGVGSFSGVSQDKVMEGQVYNLTLDYNQTIDVEDKVTINSNDYRVTGVNTDTSEVLAKRAKLVRWE